MNSKPLIKVADWLLSLAILFPAALVFHVGTGEPIDRQPKWEALFFFYLSAVLVAAFFSKKRLQLFQALIWLCENLFIPRGRRTALLLAFVFAIVASVKLHEWLTGPQM